MPKNKVIPQMFDVRPVDETGDLDWQKIQAVGLTEEIEEIAPVKLLPKPERAVNAYILGVPVESKDVPVLHDSEFNINNFPKANKDLQYAFLVEQERQRLELLREKTRQEKLLQEQVEMQRLQKQAELEELKKQQIELAKKLRQEQLQQERLAQEEKIRLELERKEQQRLMLIEQERLQTERKKQDLLKMQEANQEKEAALLAEKLKMQQLKQEQIRQEALLEQERLLAIVEENRRNQQQYEELVRREREERDRQQAIWLEEEMRQSALEQENLLRLQQEKTAAEKAEKIKIFSNKKVSKRNSKRKKDYIAGEDASRNSFSWSDLFFPPHFSFQFDASRALTSFVVVALLISLGVGTASYASKGLGLKGKVLGVSQDAYENLNAAMSDMANQNFAASSQQFDKAYADFAQSSNDLEDMGGILMDVTKYVPFASKISSGKNAVEAGKHFSAAGKLLNEVAQDATELKDPANLNKISLLDVFEMAEKNISQAKVEIDAAQKNIDNIAIDDLPQDKQAKFLLLKQRLPELRQAMQLFSANSQIFADLLGGNGPRKYLFLFQNNSEMRATGGFIGSYGLLDIADGHIKKFFIDGIFNPDGQLKDRVIPPAPIQKISAAWSMHDSNWFPNFPTSAQKAIYFYEKTGGPTADGVITFTPTMMQKLLEITGPITMPEYGVTLDSKNFIELTQYKVEVDYDKQENKPKKILADLAPLVLEKLLNSNGLANISKTMQAFLEGLQEKHILLYSQNEQLEKLISQQGWSGEIIPTSKDYLSVINSNINGYKTDAIVSEAIEHKAEIQADGSIVDTVKIVRKHNGGNSPYEWLNKVNADYLRVYVPKGSKLLETSGQTREVDKAPLDYAALGFRSDEDVKKQEDSIVVDPESGTRIYQEDDKTVFANWTYVSAGETMTLTYKYLLPFKLFNVLVGSNEQADSYSLTMQKQAGSLGSAFDSELTFPANYEVKWNFPQQAKQDGNSLKNQMTLDTDKFEGVVFEKK